MRRNLELFRFKKFSVSHNNSTIAVGTDAVLLGSWLGKSDEEKGFQKCLDVGTGCGLIALCLAQRLTDAQIHALDIDQLSLIETQVNFDRSPWSSNLTTFHTEFKKHLVTGYDLIVCNPPFFRNAQKNKAEFLKQARHQVSFDMNIFARFCSFKLKKNGVVGIVYPLDDFTYLKDKFELNNLYVKRVCKVYPKLSKQPSRVLVEFSKENAKEPKEEILVVYKEDNSYTGDYRKLTKEFYLNF